MSGLIVSGWLGDEKQQLGIFGFGFLGGEPIGVGTVTTQQTQIGRARLTNTSTATQLGKSRITLPAVFPCLFDSDFSDFPIGTPPPYASSAPPPSYGDVADYYAGGFGPIVDNSFPGIFSDPTFVDLRGDGLQFPILPTLTLTEVLSGITYVSLGVPFYQQFSLFQGFRVTSGSDLQKTLLTFNSNVHPFAGVQCAAIHVNSDGTISINGQGIAGPCSDYSLLIQQWYFMQVNIDFFWTPSGNAAFNCAVAVNGLEVVSGTLVTSSTSLPGDFINNIVISPTMLGRLTITDSIRAIGDNPHPGSPVARLSEGVIELILSPNGVISFAKMHGPAGISYTNS